MFPYRDSAGRFRSDASLPPPGRNLHGACHRRNWRRCSHQRTGCRKGIAFDTRNLYQPANRVASQSQVMLQPHLGRILDLCRQSPRTTDWPQQQPSHKPHRPLPGILPRPRKRMHSYGPHYRTTRLSPTHARYGSHGSRGTLSDGKAQPGMTPHEPQVGAVTILPPQAFSSETARAYA